MTTTPLSHYHWLASAEGAQQLHQSAAWRADGVSDLKIGERLRENLDVERAALVLTQIDLRARAAEKFERAHELLFTRAGLEQATNERIASYRARRFDGQNRITDLCCGIGGDLMALTTSGAALTAVDLDPVHLFLAEHNARVVAPQADVTPLLMDVRDVKLSGADAVFIDPARRTGTGHRLGYESEPPVEWSVSLADRASAVGIKSAPGIPHSLVPPHWELELISLCNDLKEAVLWSPQLRTSPRRATVIAADAIHTLSSEAGDEVPVRAAQPGQWLHDVNPAVTNAGLVQDLARSIGADRIDAEIGFLVTDADIASPFTTGWRILSVLPWHEKRIKHEIAALDIGPIDIRRRGLPGDVPAITKRLRGKGSRRALIAMTRMDNQPTAIICAM